MRSEKRCMKNTREGISTAKNSSGNLEWYTAFRSRSNPSLCIEEKLSIVLEYVIYHAKIPQIPELSPFKMSITIKLIATYTRAQSL